MQYDFDKIIDRRGTDSVKWQFYEQDEQILEREPDEIDLILPLWVADMDFPSPQPVVDAIVARAQHGLYGYTGQSRAYNTAVSGWMQRRHGWEIQSEWICVTPGVVNGLHTAVQALTEPGDKVLIQPPVYHPFTFAIERTDRLPARVPLILENGRYRMDFVGLEQAVRDPAVKLTILCSPHNPVGSVWTDEDLRRFGAICNENGVIVIADEVFGDLIYPGVKFTAYGSLGDEFQQNAIICTSPSKTFNLPGLKTSNLVIPNEEIREKFKKRLAKNGLYGVNAFGSTAVQAAYLHGEDWLAQVLVYIEANFKFLKDYLAKHLPEVVVIQPQGTYLAWVDFRPLGVGKGFCKDKLIHEARVYLDDGGLFGPEGDGYARFNIACPREILEEGLERIVGCF